MQIVTRRGNGNHVYKINFLLLIIITDTVFLINWIVKMQLFINKYLSSAIPNMGIQ